MGMEIYEAGNSPFDSQGYTSEENGVGLEIMREYCELTSKKIATERKAKYLGVEYEEYES